MTKTGINIDASIDRRAFVSLPLLHGSLELGERQGHIREHGLLAPGDGDGARNSFAYDRAAGRVQYVFATPPHFRGDYGGGRFLLIDPVAVGSGAIASLSDFGDVWQWLKLAGEGRPADFLHRHRIRALDRLERVFASYPAPAAGRSGEAALLDLIRTEAFRRGFLDHYYETPGAALASVARAASTLGWSWRRYFDRKGDVDWPHREEILLPGRVEPHRLLGYWNGVRFEAWAAPATDETAVLLEVFLAGLRRGGPVVPDGWPRI